MAAAAAQAGTFKRLDKTKVASLTLTHHAARAHHGHRRTRSALLDVLHPPLGLAPPHGTLHHHRSQNCAVCPLSRLPPARRSSCRRPHRRCAGTTPRRYLRGVPWRTHWRNRCRMRGHRRSRGGCSSSRARPRRSARKSARARRRGRPTIGCRSPGRRNTAKSCAACATCCIACREEAAAARR